MDVNVELKFFMKIHKKKSGGGVGSGRGSQGGCE